MSITSDFWKAMNQSGSKVSSSSSQKSSSGSAKNTSGSSTIGSTQKKKKKSITEEFWEAMEDDDIAPISRVSSRVQLGSDLAPVKKDKEEEEEDKRSWFQKGVFEDGYQAGDISKAILGTLADVGESIVTGAAATPEKMWQGLMELAPAMTITQQVQNNPTYQFDPEEYQELKDASKELAGMVEYDETAVAKQILSNVYGKGDGTLTFQCEDTPAETLAVNVLILNGNAMILNMAGSAIPSESATAREKLELSKELWSGTWDSGTIEVPGSSNYRLFEIIFSGVGTAVVAARRPTTTVDYVRGTAALQSITYQFYAEQTDETWSLVTASTVPYSSDGSSGGGESLTVTSIVGLC